MCERDVEQSDASLSALVTDALRACLDAQREQGGRHRMSTEGIDAVFLETLDRGRAARFFTALDFAPDFETDHGSTAPGR